MKTMKLSWIKAWPAAGAVIAALALSLSGHAALQIPYTPDADTLHLWHLDEPNGLSAADVVETAPIPLTVLGLPNPGTGPYTNTSLGNVSFPGLGTCMSGNHKAHLLYGGAFPDVSQFRNPESGAFTFEALVKFDINPLGTIDHEIVSGDNAGGITTRGWQWRIFNGVMEWDLLAGSTDNDFKAPLPATGPNAAVVGVWYHVAVTYTGENPINGDPPNLITFYWTLLDPNRTTADQLGQFTATRPLNGSPQGTSQPSLGIGGSARAISGANPGNNEGFIGSVDEVRISSVARAPDQMAFMAGGTLNPPSFTTQPTTNTLVGYGKTLTVAALVSGTLPLHYQWRLNEVDVPGQNETTLVVPGVTFAQAGRYQLVVTNEAGSVTSTVAQVTVGSAAAELFGTGVDSEGVVSEGNVVDPHWTLVQSADTSHLGPDTMIFENSFPLIFASPTGSYSPTNGYSMWIGPAGNQGGNYANSPVGQYTYRTQFLLDSADPATVTLKGNLWVAGSIPSMVLNGKSTGISLAPGGTLYAATFAITNGFVQGVNTLDILETITAGASALRVDPLQVVGLALPPGLPDITQQPANQTVRDASMAPGSQAAFSVTAYGRPPLAFQWWADGAPLSGATSRALTFIDPTAGAQGRAFSVVVSNDSGSVTSQVAVLTLVSENQPPAPAGLSFVNFSAQTLTLQLSDLVQKAHDPDHDAITFGSADSASANGQNNVNASGASLVYSPVPDFVGFDQFGYTLSDSLGGTVQGFVNILQVLQPANQVVAPGDSAVFDLGLSEAPPGYSFQWQHNGVNVPGATTSRLIIEPAREADAGAYTVVITDALGQAWSSTTAALTVGSLGDGTGLIGEYYNYSGSYSAANAPLTPFSEAPAASRVDATVDFDWTTTSPDGSITADNFTVRWHGQVLPLYSQLYTFYTKSDDGTRLWINGQLVVNNWFAQSATERSGTIALQGGQLYDLLMEYFERTGSASAQLSWSSAGQAKEVIPVSQLFPANELVQPRLTAALSNATNLVLNWAGTFTLESAPAVTGPWSPLASLMIGPYTVPVGTAPQKFFRLVSP
jgi:hypothetical protein